MFYYITSEELVSDRTEGPPTTVVDPGVESLPKRCIYDSFTASVVVLAFLLALIVLLLLLLVMSICVMAKKFYKLNLNKYR